MSGIESVDNCSILGVYKWFFITNYDTKKMTNTRKDFQHKLSLQLVKNQDVLVIEDLYVKYLMKNKKQSRHWAELAHGGYHKMLKYKCMKYCKLLVEADCWFPSSKLCSNCLMMHLHLMLKDRVFWNYFCGLEIDRDYNAAINLEQYFYMFILPQLPDKKQKSITTKTVANSSLETINACEETVRPVIKQVRLNEAGRQALKRKRNKCPN